ncbi:MAG TPA: protoporphyrinogen oxidase [Bryobacteraceae bacterium]|nr:protoporphyrinogen oxidase [Bryobacteraceae bacterium]
MRPVVIVGGGISGLSTAYFLSQAGIPLILVEREPKLGGLIQTEHIDGFIVEGGPDSFLTSKPWARELIHGVGLAGDIIGSNDHRRATYIWKGSRLIQMPEGLSMMVPARISPILTTPLLSFPAKLRAFRELFRRPVKEGPPDRSIADFVIEHYGQEMLDYVAEPLLAGIFGGDPKELSAASVLPKFVEWESKYGSLSRAARHEIKPTGEPAFTSLRHGMGSLIEALQQQTRATIVRGTVDRIEQGWRVRVNGEWIDTSHLVLACRDTESVLPSLFPSVPYSSSTVVALAYRREDVPHAMQGFGFLVPKRERKSVAACTWVQQKFEHRVPPDKVLLRCFVTGDVGGVPQELNEKMGIRAEPLFRRVFDWPHSMPQYTVGHAHRVETIEGMLKDLPGLHLVTNALYGIGIPDCVRLARRVAEKIRAGASGA